MTAFTIFVVMVAGLHAALGQLAGNMVEMPPPVDVAYCTKTSGCEIHHAHATMDANWRWIHGMQCSGGQCNSGGNCYSGSGWDKSQCPDPQTCSENCALEAITAEQYTNTYGVSMIKGGLELGFMTGQNAGSRLYLTEGGGKRYKLFKLKNREFSFDVDVSSLSCGLNGAVYFSEMEATGGMGGHNKAGAKYGTGYCDAQCPHDVKFMDGKANILDWNTSSQFGKWGACCAEMDIWEANKEATAFTSHPCSVKGTKTCTSQLECGGYPYERKYRYDGVCDKDGCDFNSFRDGDQEFFGKDAGYTVDSSKPVTVVTQWITEDGTDEGDLVEIRRLHVQDGTVIQNSVSSVLPGRAKKDDSITEEYCDAQKKAFDDPNEHKKKGGLKAMGEALDRGMVLVVSLWDDKLTHMKWLDSYSRSKSAAQGGARGPCRRSSGSSEEVRGEHGDATVKYTNFMYGELDSTYNAGPSSKPEAAKQPEWPAQASVAQSQPFQQGGGQTPAGGAQQPAAPAPGPGSAFSQCGGKNGPGDIACGAGCKCVSHGAYYSQCTPPAGAWQCGAQPISMAAIGTGLPMDGAERLRAGGVALANVGIASLALVSLAAFGRRGWHSRRQTGLLTGPSEDVRLLDSGEDA